MHYTCAISSDSSRRASGLKYDYRDSKKENVDNNRFRVRSGAVISIRFARGVISQRSRSFRVGRSLSRASKLRERKKREREKEREREREREREGSTVFNIMLILFKPTRPVSCRDAFSFFRVERREIVTSCSQDCLPFDKGRQPSACAHK